MRRRLALAALLVAAAVLAAACGDDDVETQPIVDIFGPYRGDEAAFFTAGLDDWAEEEGIDVRYTGSADFASAIQYRVSEILSPPDIALVPQPGLVREFASRGALVPFSDEVTEAVGRHYADEVLEIGRIDGALVGFPYRANVKSLVWYRPEILAEFGATPPTTMTELEALVEDLEAADQTPWCLGLEAQSATGWPATDWVEDLIIRRAGVELYDDWVAGAVPFSDVRIADAFAAFRDLVLQPARVAGGVSSVLSTSTRASDDPLFADPPGCVLFKQASFAYGWMPPGLEVGPDGDIAFFVLPPDDATDTAPIVAGADLAVAFSDRPEVAAVLERLASPEAGRAWAEGGSYLSLRSDVDPTDYYRGADQAVAELLAESDTIVFDGSDSMPPAVGTALFWSEITAWVAGQRTFDDLAATLDAARTG